MKQFVVQDDDNTNKKITAELKDDTTIEDIDIVFVGSGYTPNPSFIHVRNPDATSSTKSIIPLMSQARSPQPRRIPSLHKYILYAYNPTVAFIGSVMCFTPFTIADVSSTWLTLAWSNQVPFPPTPKTRLQFEKERIEDIEQRRKTEALETGCEVSSLFTYSALGASKEYYAADLETAVVAATPELESV